MQAGFRAAGVTVVHRMFAIGQRSDSNRARAGHARANCAIVGWDGRIAELCQSGQAARQRRRQYQYVGSADRSSHNAATSRRRSARRIFPAIRRAGCRGCAGCRCWFRIHHQSGWLHPDQRPCGRRRRRSVREADGQAGISCESHRRRSLYRCGADQDRCEKSAGRENRRS